MCRIAGIYYFERDEVIMKLKKIYKGILLILENPPILLMLVFAKSKGFYIGQL